MDRVGNRCYVKSVMFYRGCIFCCVISYKRTSSNYEKYRELREHIIFYKIPEKLVDKKEAQCIVEEILNIEPDNKVALGVKY